MAWSERQASMLKEMGLRVDTQPALVSTADHARPTAGPRAVPVAVPVSPPVSAARVAATQAKADATASATATATGIGLGIAAMDWPELRGAVASCRACQLCDGRTQTVFGVGPSNAHWMVVGEAPGEQEDLQGEPFVGKSGQLLDNMLRALGLSRNAVASSGVELSGVESSGVESNSESDPSKSVYIANSVKCRPPGNRNPSADELAQCEPYLMRQVALLQPKIILAMGRFAVQSLLRSTEPIGKLRGRVHDYCGVPLIVTYHPAYLLRNLEEKARAWDDLCLAAQVYDEAR